MNIAETLAHANRSIEEITRIYHGKDHDCRCGCSGRYFEKGTVGFKRALTALSKDTFQPLVKGDLMLHSQNRCWVETEGVQEGRYAGKDIVYYINIPYDAEHDKCYVIYFG